MDDISPILMGVTANTIKCIAFLRSELDDIGIMVNPAKNVALLPNGHAPTVEEVQLVKRVDVRVADKEGVTVVGVPIVTDKYVLE